MKKLTGFLLLTCIAQMISAQVTFKTLIKSGPVVAGDPFPVQYVLENIGERDEFIPPKFKYLRLVSGPDLYVGSVTTNGETRTFRNLIYTLVADKPGRYIVPGGSVRTSGSIIAGENNAIEVISKDEAIRRGLMEEANLIDEESYLHPGEDPQEKIRRNLFMKLMVDRKSCYVGQPVVATFKVYSRLRFNAGVPKNPGFYGFTIQDIIGLGDKAVSCETINGKIFNVYTVRKIQLYPLRPGSFTIDPMELRSRVEFSKSPVNRKKEAEIVEGLFNDPEDLMDSNSIIAENTMRTEPVTIEVKATPEKNKPEDYSGAVGHFQAKASISDSDIVANEGGELVIEIKGNGNFTQLSAPSVEWPKGLESFEPEIKDSLDHHFTPMAGSRTFKFRFVAAKPGSYTIPSLSFHYFDIDSNRYRTASTRPLTITVRQSSVAAIVPDAENADRKVPPVHVMIWAGLPFAALLLSIAGYFLWRKKRKERRASASVTEKKLLTVSEILQDASILSGSESRAFHATLREAIWTFFREYFELTGSGMNKHMLTASMRQQGIEQTDQQAILRILDECEAGIFTQADTGNTDQAKLVEDTRNVLERIRQRTLS